jgi:hypothetical protein
MPSAVIRSFSYDASSRKLSVVFQTGRQYAYLEVPEDMYLGLQAAFSKGEFFNLNIRDRYRCMRNPATEE